MKNTGRKSRKSCAKDAKKKIKTNQKISLIFDYFGSSASLGIFCVFCATFAPFASGIQIL
jgi:hypothetical protein